MAARELTDDENGYLRELVRAEIARLGSANKLALALGMQGSSLGEFLKGGGWSKDTARKFAAYLGKPYEEVLGHMTAQVGRRTPPIAPGKLPGAYRPTPKAAKRARLLLREHPQNFTDAAIDIAEEETWLTNPEDAEKSSAVAEAWRHAILGSAVHFPLRQSPSSSPPAGTRRSRMRDR